MQTLNTVRVPTPPRIALEHGGVGPLVVFLHGIGGNRSNWRCQLDAVAPFFHAAAWDARGYGDSDDYDGPLQFGDFSADLVRVLDHLEARAAHLVGLSMGGFIAQDFYRRHPDRVLSLVLADTRNGFQRPDNDNFLKAREAPLLAGLAPRDIAAKLAPNLASPAVSETALEQIRLSIAALHKDSYLKTLRETTLIADSLEYRGKESFVDLHSVRVPTLVVCGTDDRVAPPAHSHAMANAIAGAQLQLIEGAGHLSNIEKPEAFNRCLLEFLQKVSQR